MPVLTPIDSALSMLMRLLITDEGRVSFERNGAEVVIRISEFRDRTLQDILALAEADTKVVAFRPRRAA